MCDIDFMAAARDGMNAMLVRPRSEWMSCFLRGISYDTFLSKTMSIRMSELCAFAPSARGEPTRESSTALHIPASMEIILVIVLVGGLSQPLEGNDLVVCGWISKNFELMERICFVLALQS